MKATVSGVDLLVNCYERTYRDVLTPGFFPGVESQNQVGFRERWCLINNVLDPGAAEGLARTLVARGEITGYRFVSEHIAAALRVTGVPSRALRRRPYLLDYGLVMGITGTSDYVLGWDAETVLESPANWVQPGLALLDGDRKVFSVSPRWQPRHHDTLEEETVERVGPWHMNFGFSDQVWLVRRHDLAAPIFRSFAPAALARHSDHPWSFEARLEAYQRVSGRLRATHETVTYLTNHLDPVIQRLGGADRWESARASLLRRSRRYLLNGWRSPRLKLP